MTQELLAEKKAELTKLKIQASEYNRTPDLSDAEFKAASECVAKLQLLESELKLAHDLGAASSSPFSHSPASDGVTEDFVAFGSKEDLANIKDSEGRRRRIGATKNHWNVVSKTSYAIAFDEYQSKKGKLSLMSPTNIKTLQEGDDGSGGFFVPQDYIAEIIMKEPGPTEVLGRVRKFTTSRDQVVMPKLGYNTDDIFVSEMDIPGRGELPATAASALSATPTVGAVTIPVHTYTGWIPVSLNLLDDSAFDTQQFIVNQFAMYSQLSKDQQVIKGNGAGNPVGLVTLAAGSVGGVPQIQSVAMSAGAATGYADALMEIPYQLAPQYALKEDNLVFILNRQNTAQYIAKLKTTTNQYLFSYGFQDQNLASARPKELAGYEIIYDSFMPNSTTSGALNTNGTPIIFGDLSGYFWVNRMEFSVKLLDQPLYTQGMVQINARYRCGGLPVEQWKFVAGVQTA